MNFVRISDLQQLIDYMPLKEPVEFKGFKAVGYFPYEKAQLSNTECVVVPRNVFSDIEIVLSRNTPGCMDNKVVFVFEETTGFGTDDFAIQFKDGFCKMGKLEQIMGYACRTLHKKIKG